MYITYATFFDNVCGSIIVVLVLHLYLSCKLPQKHMLLCPMFVKLESSRFFVFLWILYSDLSTVCCIITARGSESLYNCDGPGRIQCLCSLSADIPKWGLYGVAEQKGVWRTVFYNGFRFVLGYCDWRTLNTQWHRLSRT